MRILLSIVFNAVALYATAMVVPGICFHGSIVSLLVAGAIFGLFQPDRAPGGAAARHCRS